MGLRGRSQCLPCWNTASCFPDSQFPTRQPHSPGGGLPVGELGLDPQAYSWTDQMLTVSITDAQWDKWGQPGGWTMSEPDTRPEHFHSNLAVVLCKGIFDDATDPELVDKVCHYMTIAQVPDCIELLPFNQVWEAFNRYNEATTRVGLVRLHQSNEVFPDIYFQYCGEHFTILGLSDLEIRFGTAD